MGPETHTFWELYTLLIVAGDFDCEARLRYRQGYIEETNTNEARKACGNDVRFVT